MEHRRALRAIHVAGDGVEVIPVGMSGEAGGGQVVALLASGQQHLADGDAIAVEGQHAPLLSCSRPAGRRAGGPLRE